MRPTHPQALHYLVLDFPDSADQNLLETFEDAHAFIQEARDAGGAVLVHWLVFIFRHCPHQSIYHFFLA